MTGKRSENLKRYATHITLIIPRRLFLHPVDFYALHRSTYQPCTDLFPNNADVCAIIYRPVLSPVLRQDYNRDKTWSNCMCHSIV
jgi:hypothetical protein